MTPLFYAVKKNVDFFIHQLPPFRRIILFSPKRKMSDQTDYFGNRRHAVNQKLAEGSNYEGFYTLLQPFFHTWTTVIQRIIW